MSKWIVLAVACFAVNAVFAQDATEEGKPVASEEVTKEGDAAPSLQCGCNKGKK